MVTFDATIDGTSADEWKSMERLRGLPGLDLSGIRHLAVIAAHPDDETLGAGGLLAECSSRGIPTQVVVVTDGAGSHPHSTAVKPAELAAIRQRELFLAVSELSPGAEVVMLGFADGETDQTRKEISAALARVLHPDSTLVAPWRGDGHRDHRVVAEICAEVAHRSGSTLFEYPIWMWHWARPDDERVPWHSAVSLPLSHSGVNAKLRAVARHTSQVVGVGSGEHDGPVVSARFASNFEQDRELFLVSPQRASGTKSEKYFDSLYETNPDPWRLKSRWYEERKRAITVASLPRERFTSGLEIGCSTGELTAMLGSRCDSLLALDISGAAVESASRRVAGLDTVRITKADATRTFPRGTFDLIVLSEVAYYWDRETLVSVLENVMKHLATDGVVLACHWRHPVEDYPLGGDEVHDLLRSTLGLASVAVHDEADFLLEVFAARSTSVAEREGLVEPGST